jgi:hypothetical protein
MVFCNLAQTVVESLEGKKLFFLALKERPTEAPFRA